MTETDALFERLQVSYDQNPEEIEREEPLIAKALAKAKAGASLEQALEDTREKLRLEQESNRQGRKLLAGAQEELNALRPQLEDEAKVRLRLRQMQEQFVGALEDAVKQAREPIYAQDDLERRRQNASG